MKIFILIDCFKIKNTLKNCACSAINDKMCKKKGIGGNRRYGDGILLNK
jgi:hypothetical protein